MQQVTWPAVRALVDEVSPGWSGLWSLMTTAERAVGALVQVTSFAEALDLIWLGEELRAACDDVAARRPADVLTATATDLGPVTDAGQVDAARKVVAGLVSAVICRGDELLAQESSAKDGLWLTGLTSLLFAARTHLLAAGAR